MDTIVSGPNVLTEAILSVDVTGFTSLGLSFWHKDVSDEEDILAQSFVGSFNGDGVSFSADGTTSYRLTPELFAGLNVTYEAFAYDLTAAAASAGVTLGNVLQIKFQQFDNFPFDTDGRAFDDILVTGTPINGTPVPEPTTLVLIGAGIAAAVGRRRRRPWVLPAPDPRAPGKRSGGHARPLSAIIGACR